MAKQVAEVSSELQPYQILLTEFRLPLNEIWRENCKVPLFVRVFFLLTLKKIMTL